MLIEIRFLLTLGFVLMQNHHLLWSSTPYLESHDLSIFTIFGFLVTIKLAILLSEQSQPNAHAGDKHTTPPCHRPQSLVATLSQQHTLILFCFFLFSSFFFTSSFYLQCNFQQVVIFVIWCRSLAFVRDTYLLEALNVIICYVNKYQFYNNLGALTDSRLYLSVCPG